MKYYIPYIAFLPTTSILIGFTMYKSEGVNPETDIPERATTFEFGLFFLSVGLQIVTEINENSSN